MLFHSIYTSRYLHNIPAKECMREIHGKEKLMDFTSNPFGFLSSMLGDTDAEYVTLTLLLSAAIEILAIIGP